MKIALNTYYNCIIAYPHCERNKIFILLRSFYLTYFTIWICDAHQDPVPSFVQALQSAFIYAHTPFVALDILEV